MRILLLSKRHLFAAAMRLDANQLRFMTRDDFRVLTAVEMGMKNHELVPAPLIESIANLKRGGCYKILSDLLKNKLLAHDGQKYNGYKLTYMGLDYLALRVFVQRGTIAGVGRRIGVGKESDIYECVNERGEIMAIKAHRLGRVSFKTVKSKRDYLQHRKSASWMYMSRLAAVREYSFLKALHEHEFPVPTPIDQNRHCIVMSMVDARPFGQVRELRHTSRLYNKLMNLIVRIAEHGLIHGDFNEFNLMINDKEEPTLIDFPQMVSTSHPNAAEFFKRDVDCIRTWFAKRYDFHSDDFPHFESDITKQVELDISLAASGFSKEEAKQLEAYFASVAAHEAEHGTIERTLEDAEEEDEDDEEEHEDEDDDEEYDDDQAAQATDTNQDEYDEEDDGLHRNNNFNRKVYNKSALAAQLKEHDEDEDDEDSNENADDDEDDESEPELDEKQVEELIKKHMLMQRRQNANGGDDVDDEDDEDDIVDEDEEEDDDDSGQQDKKKKHHKKKGPVDVKETVKSQRHKKAAQSKRHAAGARNVGKSRDKRRHAQTIKDYK